MKTRQVLKMSVKGIRISIVEKCLEINPYRVYFHYWMDGKFHKREIARYADVASALYHIYTINIGSGGLNGNDRSTKAGG